MPYRPIYVAAFETHEGTVEFTWDRDREPIHEAHKDDAYLVQTGELKAAKFTLLDTPAAPAQIRAWLLAHPTLWRP